MKRKITIIRLLFFIFLLLSGLLTGAADNNSLAEPNISGTEKAAGLFDLLTELLMRSTSKEDKAVDDIQKFETLYTKFYYRPQLITEDVLHIMYNKYKTYNVLIDFIEKIPIQKPETVLKLFRWVENFQWFKEEDKALYTSTFQSLLELFSHAARYAPDRNNYDDLVGKMVDIPFDRSLFYDKIFEFLEIELNIKLDKKNLIDFVLEGINNQTLNIDNIDYEFMIKDIYKKNIEEILQTQGVCSLPTLLRINRLFDRLILERENLSTANDIVNRISELLNQLPYAEISKEAPKSIRERVMFYSRESLNKDLKILDDKISNIASISEVKSIIEKIKKNYLSYQLKDHLLTLVYAVNAKNPKLRIFLNPNMVRLHDFGDHKDHTAWNYSGTPSPMNYLSSHYFSGGLSRLNLAFAAKWQDHLFSQTYIHDSTHVQSVLTNLLNLYPLPRVDQIVAYNALLVDFGLELLRKSRDNETVREEVMTELSTITTGYHYRKAVHYLTGKSRDHGLFFSEIKKLGERFFKKRRYLEGSTYMKQLEAFNREPLVVMLKNQAPWFGNIYYYTFGNLSPQQFRMFPQGVANLFENGWTSGEMIDEFKIALSWHLYKKNIPSFLLGEVLYSFIIKTAPMSFSQNHPNDYFSTYFLSKIFDDSYVKSILKKLQQQGYMRLK